jgi:hypothetical protein
MIVNEGLQEVSFNLGSLIVAFGKGKFAARASSTDVDHTKEVMFSLKDLGVKLICTNCSQTLQMFSKRSESTNAHMLQMRCQNCVF